MMYFGFENLQAILHHCFERKNVLWKLSVRCAVLEKFSKIKKISRKGDFLRIFSRKVRI